MDELTTLTIRYVPKILKRQLARIQNKIEEQTEIRPNQTDVILPYVLEGIKKEMEKYGITS